MTEQELIQKRTKEQRIAELPRYKLLTQQGDYQDETYFLQQEDGEYVVLADVLAAQAPLIERIAELERQNAEALGLLKRLKLNLMHARRFAPETLNTYRHACTNTEGDIEEFLAAALAASNGQSKGGV